MSGSIKGTFSDAITIGNNPPDDLNVIIEIPMNSNPIKYEIDHNTGVVFVDRINAVPMFYPCNYGFVPHTLAGDGDPIDVMVISRYPFIVGSVVNVRPIGVIFMEDDGGKDDKIIAVPHKKVTEYYNDINDISDLPEILVKEISHYFAHYKDLNTGKWSKVSGFDSVHVAKKIISDAIKNG